MSESDSRLSLRLSRRDFLKFSGYGAAALAAAARGTRVAVTAAAILSPLEACSVSPEVRKQANLAFARAIEKKAGIDPATITYEELAALAYENQYKTPLWLPGQPIGEIMDLTGIKIPLVLGQNGEPKPVRGIKSREISYPLPYPLKTELIQSFDKRRSVVFYGTSETTSALMADKEQWLVFLGEYFAHAFAPAALHLNFCPKNFPVSPVDVGGIGFKLDTRGISLGWSAIVRNKAFQPLREEVWLQVPAADEESLSLNILRTETLTEVLANEAVNLAAGRQLKVLDALPSETFS
ncbi:MAG: twin-arginine translocation signal domain-containing protein, partial [bacterium]|nr:twin-arginine translocation signal domain-containing protein [bacterium]